MPNVEEQLLKAIEEGKFDDLPGKGKPLRLDEANPHADSDWELAYHIIKESGFTLPWIEDMHEIEKDLEAARGELKRAWKWLVIYLSADVPEDKASVEWKRAQADFKDKLEILNKRIRNYNLEVPNMRFQRPVLSYEKEIDKIINLGEW
jgi:DnaJ family protein C protein 28